MKTLTRTLIVLAIVACAMTPFTANAQQKGDQASGLKLALGRNVGIGAKYRYSFTDRIRMDDSFTYYLPKTEGSGMTKTKISYWEIGVNAHYLFPLIEGLDVYPLAGLAVLNVSTRADLGELGKFSESASSFGVNFGGGADYFLSEKMFLNAEAGYMTCGGGMFVVSAGVGFMF